MRVLILSALVALAVAAPADVVAPVEATPEPMPSEDADVAAADTKILAEDQAQFAADQAQFAADQARMFTDVKAIEADTMKEMDEEKKWQAIDAEKTAEAKIDGAVASSSPLVARAAFGNVYVPGVVPAPLFYSAPALFAPTLKVAEQPKDEKMAEPMMNTAEPAKEAEKPIFAQPLLAAPLTYPTLKVASPWMSPYAAPLTYSGLPTYYQAPLVAPYLRQW